MDLTTTLGGKTVSRIGFGAMQLAGPGVMGPPRDPEAARAVLRRAVELGIDHIDTSQFYGPDTVNEVIHDALHPYPENLKLVTKVGARRTGDGAWLPAMEPAELRAAVEENLRSLEVERIDLVNLRLMSPDGKPASPQPEQLGLLEEMRDEGKLDLIGVSHVSVEGAALAMELVQVAAIQNAYSIADRENEPLLGLCRERGIPFVPFFPLGSAFTGGPGELARDPAIAEVAERNGATPAQVALAWLLHRYERMLLIPGTTSIAHLEENVAAGDLVLSDGDLERLDGVEQLGDPMSRIEH